MLCEACNQNAATVHLTEIVNKKKTELHLCESCAEQQGYKVKSQFSVSNLLSGLVSGEGKQTEHPAVDPGKVCPVCGLSFQEFRSTGRLGCATDYVTFRRELMPLLEKIHGRTEHVGRAPQHVGEQLQRKKQLLALKQRLNRAIQKEDYEEAARLRDEIYELEDASH